MSPVKIMQALLSQVPLVNGAFRNMGENCSAASRLIVHKDVKDALLEKVKAHAREWNVGDPLDPSVRMGALVSKSHFDKVCGYLAQAKKDPAALGRALFGGWHSDRGLGVA